MFIVDSKSDCRILLKSVNLRNLRDSAKIETQEVSGLSYRFIACGL